MSKFNNQQQQSTTSDNHSTGSTASAEKLNPSHPGVLISRLDDTLEPWQWSHRSELEEVKRRSNISHNLLDQWIWKFLENKHFNVNETVAKLERRLAMERNELGTYEIDDLMRETMKSGVVQFLGEDRAGRIALYFVTNRDFPKAKHRQMRTQNFDMWLSCACRIRARDARCGITMLINQTDASLWSNTDMTFQSNIALRIAKYYPGVIEKAYVCNMSTTLSTIAKPILSAFPKAISDHIFVITKEDVRNGKLLEYFDESVLPVVMGGKNANVDSPANFQHFCDTVEDHYKVIKKVIQSGKSLKEWEMENALEECAKIEEEEKRQFREAQLQRDLNIEGGLGNTNNGGIGLDASLMGTRRGHRKRLSNESQQSQTSSSQQNQNSYHLSLSHSPDHQQQQLIDENGNPLPKSQQFTSSRGDGENESDLYTCASSEDIDALIEEYYDRQGEEDLLSDYNNDDENNTATMEYDEDGNPCGPQQQNQQNQQIQHRKNQRRLFALQRRRVVRDEAYFRSTLYELYEHQLRTFKEYYDQKTQEEEDYYYGSDSSDGRSGNDDSFSDSEEEMSINIVASSGGNTSLTSPHGGDNNNSQNRQQRRRGGRRSRRRRGGGDGTSLAAAATTDSKSAAAAASRQQRFSFLATICPKSFQSLALGFLLVLFTGSSAFFFMATLFYLMGTSSIVVLMFLSIFSHPTNIFPMSLGILLVSHQGALIASRGFELSTQALKGELILPFRWLARKFGKRYGVGLILQFLLFFAIALAMLATFIVAAVSDPLLGLQQLFAIGLYSCGVIIMLVHSFFPFGLNEDQDTSSSSRRADNSRIGLSVYFFFDITENLDAEQSTYDAAGQQKESLGGNLPTSSLVLAIFPALLSFILGVSFTIERSAFFLISAISVTLASGFTLTHFITGKLKTLTANLSRSAIWIGILVWFFFFFGLGLVPEARDSDAEEHNSWVAILVGSMVAWSVLAFLTSAAQRVDEATSYHRFFFRSAYILLTVATIAGISTLFAKHWVLGIFGLIFLFHSVACFYRPSSHSPTAMLILSIIICLVLVAIILFATNSGSNDFSINDFSVTRTGDLMTSTNYSTLFSSSYESDAVQNNYQSEFFSLCQRVWNLKGSNINLRLPDFAFFVKLAYATSLSKEQFQSFLPQWKLDVHNKPVVTEGQNQFILYSTYKDSFNNTIVAVRTDSRLFSQIKVVSLWTEAISLLPFVTILPIDWTASVIGGVSDVNELYEPFPLDVINQLQSQVEYILNNNNDNISTDDNITTTTTTTSSSSSTTTITKPETILVGHSVSGSIAAAVASRLGIRAVTFSSPGLHYSRIKFHVDGNSYDRNVLNIRTSNDAVSVVDGYGENQQVLDCDRGVTSCSSINYPLCLLSNLCAPPSKSNVTVGGC